MSSYIAKPSEIERKWYILDAEGNRIPAKQKGRWKTRKVCTTDWDDRGNAERWRAAASDAINEALREAGFAQGFVDPRSYADQAVQRIPMVHEGPDARAMENYTALKAINCYAMMPPVVTGDCFSDEQLASVVLYVQPSSLMDYKLDPFWGRFAHIEPWTYDFCAAGIYYIITSPTECAVSNHAPMGGSYTAQSITIPEKATYAGDDYKVTAIGKGAFMNCPKVKTVTMPQSVTAIGEQAFKNSGLTSIVFPRQVTAIDRQAFMGCTGLKSLTIPDHIYAIEDSAFYGCHGLTSLDLGKSVTFISNYAFAGCYNLSKVYIPHSVEAICNGAFQDCTMLTGVTLDRDFESLSIDGDVFRDCYNLSSITSLPLTPPVLDNQHGGLSSELMQKVSLMVPHSSV